MANLFTKPYKEEGPPRSKLVSILFFGLFIFLFLFLFKPFGLSGIEPLKQLIVTFGFGLVTTFMLIVFKFLLDPLLPSEKWTLGLDILWALLIAISIGIANYIYSILVFDQGFQLKYLFLSVWTTTLVGSIPVTINYFIAFNRKYRTALKDVAIVPDELLRENDLLIKAGNLRNEFRCKPGNIVLLSSNDNYVTIVTIKGDTLIRTHLRGTLKAAEAELEKDNRFFRCHKCFIVNSDYVDHISGNVQNMKIWLTHSGGEIPVSRSKASQAAAKFRTR